RFNRLAILIGPNLVCDDSDERNCEFRGKLMGSRGGFQRTVVGLRRDQHHVDMPRGATLEMLKTRLHVCDRMLAEIGQLRDQPADCTMRAAHATRSGRSMAGLSHTDPTTIA